MMPMFSAALRIARPFIDALLPSSCAYCGMSAGDFSVPLFCAACWSDFSVIDASLCPGCGRPFDSDVSLTASPGHCCRSCRLSPPLFDQALSVGYFEGALREAIHVYKYRPLHALGAPLGRWLAGNVRQLTQHDIVVPVPLHRSRLRQRGFNQALLLAHAVSIRHAVPLSCDTLLRIRATRPQVELSGAERPANVRGAFAVSRPAAVQGLRILLIDDVFTTGATLNECARALKTAGAGAVSALTLARTVE